MIAGMMFGTAALLVVGVTQYCKPEPKLFEIPIKKVNEPLLVKPNIRYVGPTYNFNNDLMVGVKFFEGFKSKKYKCCAGVPTIGYGCTDENIVALGTISEKKASYILHHKINDVRDNVRQAVTVDLTEYQLNALTSFAFNCGMTNLKTLINGENRLNSGNYESVENILPQYRKAGGKVREGLIKRRAWELSLWRGVPSIK